LRFVKIRIMVSASRLDARGRIAIVTTREAEMRWTRMSRQTYVAFCGREIVWSCRPDAGDKLR
jgi:hypothetical protein